ncbi:MAG: hypothetical protein WCT37_02525 [Patescibacteria group bacterium]
MVNQTAKAITNRNSGRRQVMIKPSMDRKVLQERIKAVREAMKECVNEIVDGVIISSGDALDRIIGQPVPRTLLGPEEEFMALIILEGKSKPVLLVHESKADLVNAPADWPFSLHIWKGRQNPYHQVERLFHKNTSLYPAVAGDLPSRHLLGLQEYFGIIRINATPIIAAALNKLE